MAEPVQNGSGSTPGGVGADVLAQAVATPPMLELGRTGLRQYSGYVYEEFLQKLLSQRGVAIYKEMSQNDATISAMLYAVYQLIQQVTWTVEPASADATATQQAEFVQSCLDDMSATWPSTLGEVLSNIVYGWSFHEVVYKRRQGATLDPTTRSRYTDGLWGWRKWGIRSQDSLIRWIFDGSGGIQGLEQSTLPDYRLVVIPIDRALLFRTTEHKGNPEGRSMLRGSYRSWWFKKRIEETEAIGIERDLAGYPVYKLDKEAPDIFNPQGNTSAQQWRDTLQRQITNIRRDEQEGAVLPWWLTLELLSTGSRRTFDTSDIITRYDQRIAMTMMADFILLGHQRVGSFALSSNKTHLFAVGLGGLLDAVASVINRYAIPRLFLLNGWPIDTLPTVKHADVETPALDEIAAYVTGLAGVGALTPDPALENYLRDAANMPPVSTTADVITKAATRLGRARTTKTARPPADPPWAELMEAIREVQRTVTRR